MRSRKSVHRRQFLHGLLLSTVAAAAWHPSALGGLLRVPPAAAQSLPNIPADFGRGKTVAIVGAGLTGLTLSYELLKSGFNVTIFEGTDRYGGRSLTVRPTDPEFRAWAVDNYRFLEDDAYVDHIPAETRGAKVPKLPAEFVTHRIGDGYFDLYMNAGPGRVPTSHTGILYYCRNFGVEMEPYIFLAETNLIQSPNFNGGQPVQVRQLLYDMMGHIAELLYAGAGDALNAINPQDAARLESRLKNFLLTFGDLAPDGRFRGTDRAGFIVPPGAGTNAGKRTPELPLEEMLNAERLWDDIMGPNEFNWQLPLLQAKGGMDMIWLAFLAQKIGGSAIRSRVRLNHLVTALTRDAKTGGPIAVTTASPEGVKRETFDYVVMTGNPVLMRDLDLANVVDPALIAKISRLLIGGGGKFGWQARERFWEDPKLGIFGGVSFTDQLIERLRYPSDGYNGPTGILTGAYMWDEVVSDLEGKFWPDQSGPVLAEKVAEVQKRSTIWSELDHVGRTKLALSGGEALHPGFSEKVYRDRGLSISWDNQPLQRGIDIWDAASLRPEVYTRLLEPLDEDGRLYLAGDNLSYQHGWMEGAVRSAWWTLGKIKSHVQNEFREGTSGRQ